MSASLIQTAPDLFGHRADEGIFDNELCVSWATKDEADSIIKAGHYSGSVVWSSSAHFLVSDANTGKALGAVQYGPPMNPAASRRLANSLAPPELMELNRMWLSDEKPPNTATRAISWSIRLLRRRRKNLRAIQSFADERCGKLGAVYQAASFLYLGCHESTFYEVEGTWFHKSMLGRAEVDKRGWRCGPKIRELNRKKHLATPHVFRQFRYLRLLDHGLRQELTMPVLPYPKGGALDTRTFIDGKVDASVSSSGACSEQRIVALSARRGESNN